MKSIYILLTRSSTCISRIINLTTADKYTHASISFEESLEPMYSFSRRFTHVPLPAGLRIEPLHTGFYKKYSRIPCALYELRVTDEIYDAAKREVETMMAEQKKYYFNIIGLILCRLNIPLRRKYHYFCSEFVSEILSRSNALMLPKAPSCMRPNDYTDISDLSCKYEGRLNKLIKRSKQSKLKLLLKKKVKE